MGAHHVTVLQQQQHTHTQKMGEGGVTADILKEDQNTND